jgi:hypothetical protein
MAAIVKSMTGPSFGDSFTDCYWQERYFRKPGGIHPVKYVIRGPMRFMRDAKELAAEINLKNLNDPVTHGVARQVGNGMQVEFAHQVSAVGLGGLDAKMKRYSDLFAGFSFGE